MKPNQQPDETAPSVVRLGLGTTALIVVVALLFAGLNRLLNLWIALTPGQDLEWNPSRAQV